ncbi:Protein of unknown function [Desulfovibrio litoralis DSM 11393]|uniref:Uncharacterized protein n=2 Tax=Desulfovibrio litoralis TaxID=466107 RepID=A0A1M7T6X6_9BACT|nr:Protein of unknown function [Desulfovibrio litoralis DSM 11393]
MQKDNAMKAKKMKPHEINITEINPPMNSKEVKQKRKTETRTAWIKIRVTPTEKESIQNKAVLQGQSVTDFIRQRALDYRLRQTALEKEQVRQIARIGANLNQLARWANTYKNRAEAIEVISVILEFKRELKLGKNICT